MKIEKHLNFYSSVKVIPDIYRKYIKGTRKETVVQNTQAFVCNLTFSVCQGIGISRNRVYINTRVLKHIYDKRPAEEFDFLVENAHKIIKYPDRIYLNKDGKRGNYCFTKNIQNDIYLCSLEVKENSDERETYCEVVTFFRMRRKKYLDSYELLWKWKDGTPSS